MLRLFMISSGLTLALMACKGGPQPTSDHSTSKEDVVTSDECCCTFIPPSAPAAIFAHGNRIECSTKQGECVDDQQCKTGDAPQP